MRNALRAFALAGSLFAAPVVHAQTPALLDQTWLSGNGDGDDLASCDYATPCLSLLRALQATSEGGEIDVLNPTDVNPLEGGGPSITRSVTIDGNHAVARFTNTGTSSDGIVVDAGTGVVVLRRLSLLGEHVGLSGIHFVSGAALIIEDSTISGFNQGAVVVDAPTGGRIFLRNVVLEDNVGGGIVVGPSANDVHVLVTRSRLSRNDVGVVSGPGASITFHRSVASGNSTAGIVVQSSNGRAGEVNLERAVLSENGTGLLVSQTGAVVRMSNSIVVDNASASTQVSAGGVLLSYGNNRIFPPGTVALTGTGDVVPGTAPADAGIPDAGVPTHGTAPGPSSTGCGCGPSTPDPLGSALVLFGLFALARRTRARRKIARVCA